MNTRRSFLKTFCGAVAAAAVVLGAKLEVKASRVREWIKNPAWVDAPYEALYVHFNDRLYTLVGERELAAVGVHSNRRFVF